MLSFKAALFASSNLTPPAPSGPGANPTLFAVGATATADGAFSSFAVNYPASMVADDIAILHIAFLYNSTNPGTPPTISGWTFIANTQMDTLVSERQMTYWRRIDGSEGASVTVTPTNAAPAGSSVQAKISVWRGCIASGTPYEGLANNPRYGTGTYGAAVACTGRRRTIAIFESNLSISTASVTPTAPLAEAYDVVTNQTRDGLIACNYVSVECTGTSAEWFMQNYPLNNYNTATTTLALIPADVGVVQAKAAGTHTFSYSGMVDEFTVGSGVSSIQFKLWGAGGAGGNYGSGVKGGGGGFTTGTIAVSPGDTIKIQVPGGGFHGWGYGGRGGYPDGGHASWGDTKGGGGGGSARVWKNGTLVAVAGGGGGGGGYSGGGAQAGPGGGASGGNASGNGGTGGTSSAGGYDTNDSTNVPKKGVLLAGENGRTGGQGGTSVSGSSTDDGGGGGGGYYGGGGGGGDGQSGGGGSGYYSGAVTSGATTAGSADVAAGTGDANYPGGSVGYGSASTSAVDGLDGKHGHAWITLS